MRSIAFLARAVEDIPLLPGVKRVVSGVGEGGMAIAFVHQLLALR